MSLLLHITALPESLASPPLLGPVTDSGAITNVDGGAVGGMSSQGVVATTTSTTMAMTNTMASVVATMAVGRQKCWAQHVGLVLRVLREVVHCVCSIQLQEGG